MTKYGFSFACSALLFLSPLGTIAETLPSSNKVIDILILYSTAAKNMHGSEAAVRGFAERKVGSANIALANSGVPGTLRIAHFQEITWRTEVEHHAELAWLQSDPAVNSLRETYGADLVSEHMTSGGVAELGGVFAVWGDNHGIFLHETGHLLGAHHDRNAFTPPHSYVPSYNYGYVFSVGGRTFADAMSYSGTHLQYFSTPNVLWEGVPLGKPEGSLDSSGGYVAADNARKITENLAVSQSRKGAAFARLENARFNGSPFYFDFAGSSAFSGNYEIERSDDFVSWSSWQTPAFNGTTLTFSDAVSAVQAQRFYRLKTNGVVLSSSHVGFIRKTVPPGDWLVGNQLEGQDHRISALWPAPVELTRVAKFDPGSQQWVNIVYDFGEWSNPNLRLAPGEGMLVRNYSGGNQVITFVGRVWMGFEKSLPKHYALVCSPIPQSGSITSLLGFPLGVSGDKVLKMANGVYIEYTSTGDNGAWSPSAPAIGFGEAFFSWKGQYHSGSSTWGNWSRSLP